MRSRSLRGSMGAAEYKHVVLGLISGWQPVVFLIEQHWGDIPPEFRERLGLKPGLVRT